MWLALLLFACNRAPDPDPPVPDVGSPAAVPPPEAEPIPDPRFTLDGVPCDPSLADAEVSPGEIAGAAIVCLRRGRSDDARTLADAAIRHAPDDPFVHYAAARARMVQRLEDGNGCARDALLADVLDHLAVAATDDVVRAKIADDDVFAEVHASWSYRRALGADAPTADALTGTRWYGPAVGAFGNTRRLLLAPAGTALHGTLDTDGDTPTWREHQGTWHLDGTTLVLGEAPEVTRYTVTERGTLQIGDDVAYRDRPAECDA